MGLNPNLFTSATKLVIDNFEGGYYHPQMYRDGRLNPNSKSFNFMRNSGETMFGLDRHAGHSLYYSSPRKSSDVWTNLNYIPTYTYKNNDSKDFWTYLDNVNAKDNWKWNEKGGSGGEKLKVLASKILFPQFEIYVKDNKWSDKAKQIVFSDAKLLFHFIYAIWNGPGFFAKWSKKLNTDVANNLSNAQILQNQLNLRSVSASGTDLSAGKMAKLFNDDNFSIDIQNLEKKSSFFLPIILILGGLIYLTTKK
jgi:hypothetical protein